MKLILVLSVLLFACNVDKYKKVDPEKPDFSTCEQSKLFFKNVRRSYYEVKVLDAAKMEIYELPSDSSIGVKPKIANHWINDRAYIMLSINKTLISNDTLIVQWADSLNQQGEYKYVYTGHEASFTFSTHLYNSIQAKHRLWVLVGSEELPFLENHEQREIFRITMFDYYKLVDLIY